MKFFNITGPCNPERHYMLPPAERLLDAQLNRYVNDQLFWTLHAPRQVGKTTFLLSWARELNAGGEYAACYVTIEGCQGIEDEAKINRIIYSAICNAAEDAGFERPEPPVVVPEALFRDTLREFARRVAPKPLVILFDEVDVLEKGPMILFLRMLRGGFATRAPGVFPVSIALVAMHDLKDFIQQAKGEPRVNPGSPFNIKMDSATIGNFSRDDIGRLFAQRTEETGQQITREALDYVWEQSQGQPWIVNSLFYRATMRVLKEDDFSTVELAHVQKAREQIIQAQETHLDALEYRLDDPEIRRVVTTLINGEPDFDFAETDGFRLAQNLGLIARVNGEWTIANPIYRETLARRAVFAAEINIPSPDNFKWRAADGSLDMDSLLKEFQEFWRENSDVWEMKFKYTEVFPQLLLMAFLQRVTNGGGRIAREYALGRCRLDLLVEFEGTRNIIEIKILRDYTPYEKLLASGLAQVKKYRDSINPGIPTYLLIFDRRSPDKKTPWNERVYTRDGGNGVTVVGL